MAGNIELITGHGESNHISSFDMRASNRATFGKGKYILNDAENMAVEIDTSAKSIKIKSGSCVWSGMHIRIETSDTVSFVSPATSDTVYVWLHYTRSAVNLVEDVEFISTTTNKVDTSLIYDELPDDVTDAYTLFYSFTFNPEGSLASNNKYDFVSVLGMNDFFEQTTQKLNVQSQNVSTQLSNSKKEFEDAMAGFEDNVLGVAFDAVALTGYEKISLSDTLYNINPNSVKNYPQNFKQILVVIEKNEGNSTHKYFWTIFPHKLISKVDHTFFVFKENGYDFYHTHIALNGSTFDVTVTGKKYTKPSLGSFTIEDISSLYEFKVKFYGLGRISG